MVFEDAQWADSTSLELLDRAIDRARLQPVMIVGHLPAGICATVGGAGACNLYGANTAWPA
jgi:predicted ATPase